VAESKKALICLCLILCLLSSPIVLAITDPYPLSGHVYDTNGTLLIGANVDITNQNTSETLSTSTNALGEYQEDAANYPSGYTNGDNLTYTVSLDGYETNTTYAIIDTSSGGTTLDIYLALIPTPTPTPTPAPSGGGGGGGGGKSRITPTLTPTTTLPSMSVVPTSNHSTVTVVPVISVIAVLGVIALYINIKEKRRRKKRKKSNNKNRRNKKRGKNGSKH
jgi:hypothetical protein